MKHLLPKKEKGFTVIEVIIALAIFTIMLTTILSFLFWIGGANTKTKADREVLENARRAMDSITYEVKGAEAIYTPTSILATTNNPQLSLRTARYLSANETDSYVDFYLCDPAGGSNYIALCLKKEGQNPSVLTADSVKVTSLSFTQLTTNAKPSIQVNLTVQYNNTANDPNSSSSVTLTSTASLRSY